MPNNEGGNNRVMFAEGAWASEPTEIGRLMETPFGGSAGVEVNLLASSTAPITVKASSAPTLVLAA